MTFAFEMRRSAGRVSTLQNEIAVFRNEGRMKEERFPLLLPEKHSNADQEHLTATITSRAITPSPALAPL